MHIPYGRQFIEEDDIQAVVETLKSDYLTTGPKVEEFEKAVADYTGAKYAVAVSSGTAALHVACLAAGLSEGDEVITSPITFAASANCALYCNATPVFADINSRTYNIDPDEIRSKITKNTKVLIPVHFTGQPCDMDEIHKIAREHNLLVIEDGAHALGAEYKGRRVGSMSDMTIFSFHPVKHITTCEGGMVVTNNEELYQRLLLFRTHGITRDEKILGSHDEPWYYEQLELGYNYRISDIQCALGISQLRKMDKNLERRREIIKRYQEAFNACASIELPYQADGCNNAWHLFVIKVPANRRKEIFNALRKSGIGVNVHYIPVYQHPYYQTHGYQKVHLKNAEAYYARCISLPLYVGLTDEQQDYVIRTVLDIVQGNLADE